jgi:hypothetical protein
MTNRFLSRWLVSSLSVSVMLPVLSLPAQARSLYGAIAYSPSTGVTTTATAWVSEAAIGQALYQCIEQSRRSDCVIKLTFEDAVGAIAKSSNGIVGVGLSQVGDKSPFDQEHDQIARDKALKTCAKSGGKNCEILAAQSAIRYPLQVLDVETVTQETEGVDSGKAIAATP